MVKTKEPVVVGNRLDLNAPTNGAAGHIDQDRNWAMEVEIVGIRPMLMHGWNCEAVAEKAAAKKGSKQKKTDNLESYVYRDEEGNICVPATYLHACLADMAKYHQDPRSPRKSAHDMVKEGLMIGPDLAVLRYLKAKDKTWDYEHRGRAVVQRAAITRTWPAFKAGWSVTFSLECLLPQYIHQDWLVQLITDAGRLKGLADYRPTFGRFQIKNWKIMDSVPIYAPTCEVDC